jgi:DNA polymerase-3 subunit gamma/tau
MSYVVLARKWRPKQFRDVVGQDHITTTLLNSIRAGRTAHAYLFVGPRGIGKTTTARIFAKALNCPNSEDGEPCGQCETCREIEQGRSIDVIEIDGASNNSVEDIRVLRENVKIAPASLRFKVYIVDEVHMLSTAAFNAFLKTLEEPPAHVKFILATTEVQKIPTTVLSRCQRFDFRRLTSRQIYGRLKEIVDAEQIPIDDRALFAIARSTEGSMRDALSILDQLVSFSEKEISLDDVHAMLGTVGQELYQQLAVAIADGDSAAILQIIDDVLERGKDLAQFLKELTMYFRNLLLASQAGSEVLVDLPEEDIAALKKVGKRFERFDLVKVIQELSDLESRFRMLPSPRVALEMHLVRLATFGGEVSIEGILSKLASLERRMKGAGGASRKSTKKMDGGTPAGPNETENEGPAEPDYDYADGVREAEADFEEQEEPGEAEAEPEPQLDLWSQFLGEVQKHQMSIYSFLNRGNFCGIENDQMIISFPHEHSYSKKHLEKKELRMLLESILSTICGRKTKIKLILEDMSSPQKQEKLAQAKPATAPEKNQEQLVEKALKNPIVQKTLELFNGKIIFVSG